MTFAVPRLFQPSGLLSKTREFREFREFHVAGKDAAFGLTRWAVVQWPREEAGRGTGEKRRRAGHP